MPVVEPARNKQVSPGPGSSLYRGDTDYMQLEWKATALPPSSLLKSMH
jgi:hypothetical protein